MSNHDTVLCRSFGDEALVRIVWAVTKEGTLISTEEGFHTWEKDGVDPVAVLAPFDAVYEYNQDLFHKLEEAFRNSANDHTKLEQLWRQAKPYRVMDKEVNR